ncbi:Histone deacetylase complex, catalytic component HDA1 [Phaffia rhodozyma]|uniref:Histone deacetylase complex, catalytic component HDA1 n=1 Tax=Phaffia rhodozyma TaxID=264483 RepID=A0A0F7SPG3_PHARH|nr:Histone deacetylase complex, catalytic component HDA1 [Phaffia rhodozyma]
MAMLNTISPPPAVFLQPRCQKHQFNRPSSKISLSNIVERPARLRAIYVGISAAVARLEHLVSTQPINPIEIRVEPLRSDPSSTADSKEQDLINQLQGLNLSTSSSAPSSILPLPSPLSRIPQLVFSDPPTDNLILSPAVKFIHAPSNSNVTTGKIEANYLEKLVEWVKCTEDKILKKESEIPEDLPQLDLYLCSESLEAIEGALSTVIQSVDLVISNTNVETRTNKAPLPEEANSKQIKTTQAFCAIRPPGHHCSQETPMGFCFVNNVLVGAAHAHLKHGIDRVIILDIDLHHGNGTQDIIYRINAETHLEELLVAGGKPPSSTARGLKFFYGSLHDIESFPCEDGNAERVKDASVSLAAHGQFIENIHLSPYNSPNDFYDRCYPRYKVLLDKAQQFLLKTGGVPEKTLVFISAGFDANQHELPGMQRHGCNVPVSFYSQFHSDTFKFAKEHALGRVISVLEGGYGDKALMSGVLSSLVGMTLEEQGRLNGEDWWSSSCLSKLEKATRLPTSRRTTRSQPSALAQPIPAPLTPELASLSWLTRSLTILNSIESHPSFPQPPPPIPKFGGMRDVAEKRVLRTRGAAVARGAVKVDVKAQEREEEETVKPTKTTKAEPKRIILAQPISEFSNLKLDPKPDSDSIYSTSTPTTIATQPSTTSTTSTAVAPKRIILKFPKPASAPIPAPAPVSVSVPAPAPESELGRHPDGSSQHI